MRNNKSIFSWLLALWLSCTLIVPSGHGIDLLFHEFLSDTSHTHKDKHNHEHSHSVDNCSLCQFHINSTILPELSAFEVFLPLVTARSFFSYVDLEVVSYTSTLYLRGPPECLYSLVS